MTKYKIQSLRSLRDEMKAVARGEQAAPADAAMPSFNSVAAVVRLLTPENRALLAIIRDLKPKSVAELPEMSGRAQPNLTRTLAKMEAAALQDDGGRTQQGAERHGQKDRGRNRPLLRPRLPQRSVEPAGRDATAR